MINRFPLSEAILIASKLDKVIDKLNQLPSEQKTLIEIELKEIQTRLQDLVEATGNEVHSSQLNLAKEAAAASEAMYRDLADSIVDALAVFDADLKLIYRNPAAEKISQIPNAQALGKTFAELYPTLVGMELYQAYLRALETRQLQTHLNHWVSPVDGSDNYYEITVYPTREGVVTISKDVTKRVQAEVALRKEHELAVWLARLPNENPNPVAKVSSEGTILYHNRVAAERFGASFAVGKPLPDALHSGLEQANRLGKKVELDVTIGDKYYAITFMPFPNDHYANLYGLDITERKLAEEALRQSEEKFARAFRSSPSGLTITRLADGRIIDANDSFLQMVEYTLEEIVGRTSIELGFHTSPEGRADILRALDGSGSVRNFETNLPTKTGKDFRALYSLEVVEIGGETCLLSTFLDITELRRLEAERIAAKAEMEVQRRLMEQREQERQAIARDIHDGPIQTLSSSSFHIKLIKEIFPDPNLHLELNQVGLSIRKSVQELREVVNDLRPPALIHFGLSRVIQIYMADFREQHPEIEFEMNIMDDGKRMADQMRLGLFRIFQEGLRNIVRHSGATKVSITYKNQHNSFLLEIRDNGKGFVVPSDFSHLTRQGHYGLAGMKERVEAVGGSFQVSSKPHHGTVIQIHGPLTDAY